MEARVLIQRMLEIKGLVQCRNKEDVLVVIKQSDNKLLGLLLYLQDFYVEFLQRSKMVTKTLYRKHDVAQSAVNPWLLGID